MTTTLLGAALISLATQGPAAGAVAELPKGRNPPPTGDGGPVEVAVGFFVLDFARVSARDESFDLTAYVELRWDDPRLAAPGRGPRRVDAGAVWSPPVFFVNGLEPPKDHGDRVLTVDAEGGVVSQQIVSGKFSAPLDLMRFPFDRQDLAVRLGSFDDDRRLALIVNPRRVGVAERAFLSDWTIQGHRSDVVPVRYVPGEKQFQHAVFTIEVDRRATFYVWRVMLPLAMLVAASWAAFWFEPSNLQPQISTTMSALLALVAFSFAIDFAMPKVPYLTVLDKIVLISFAFVVAAVGAVAAIHLAVRAERIDRARAVQRWARSIYPLMYLATFIPVLLAALGAKYIGF